MEHTSISIQRRRYSKKKKKNSVFKAVLSGADTWSTEFGFENEYEKLFITSGPDLFKFNPKNYIDIFKISI